MYNSYLEHGCIPSWNPDWYCGTPFLLFYPPLSYWIVFLLSLLGLGPILSYKIIDAFFYFIMPFIIYFLALEFNFKKRESAFAALIFALSPVVIGNYLFYDRYPNTMALCLAGLLIIFIHKTLINRHNIKWIIISALLLAGIILTHHLSAAYVALVILIMVVAFSRSGKVLLKNLGLLSIIIILSILVSSFWSIPFLLNAPEQIGNNPFYNRTIDYPYLRLSYFLDNLLTRELGIAHFAIALASIWLFYNKSRFKNPILGNKLTFMIPLLAGMGIFELGEILNSNILIYSAQILVIFAFLFLLYLFIIDFRKGTIKSEDFFFLLWFAIFLWLSLGYFAFPLARVPVLSTIWRSLDVHRFWLYLAVPMAILGGKLLNFLISKRKRIVPITTTAILLIMVTGSFIKAGYCLTQEINDQLPYNVSNNFIPPELIDYFRSEEEYGRI
ncbi:MAG: 6-pyruvoyl-tetrahydropterin synthase-related protein, partial [Candidatus Bathyarchaeota archaeon]|nr:6-pyruvoyl-tetrahydropterin synthase-related protein [Candidatus Bathyarchaeota archaeon]